MRFNIVILTIAKSKNCKKKKEGWEIFHILIGEIFNNNDTEPKLYTQGFVS